MVLKMALEHRALNVRATGFAHYSRCRSNACTVDKSAARWMTGNTIERHRRTCRLGKRNTKHVQDNRWLVRLIRFAYQYGGVHVNVAIQPLLETSVKTLLSLAAVMYTAPPVTSVGLRV